MTKSRYKYDEAYEKYMEFSLHDEFILAKKYLLLDEEHANFDVFDAVDEIYHWFCIKQNEVNELLDENRRLIANSKQDEVDR